MMDRKTLTPVAILAGAMLVALPYLTKTTPSRPPTAIAATPIPSNDSDKKELGAYILKLMDVVESPLSKSMRTIVARTMVDVTNEIFVSQDERKGFAILVSIESKFNPKARSSAGALGLSQVIPKYAPEFGERCGMPDITESDLENPTVNILVGACRFKALLEIFSGNTSMALVAYNAGQYSDQLKQLERLENITNRETSSYVAKWLFVKGKMEEKDNGRGNRPSGKKNAEKKRDVPRGDADRESEGEPASP